jgi:hypothetical protein
MQHLLLFAKANLKYQFFLVVVVKLLKTRKEVVAERVVISFLVLFSL